MSGIKKFRSNEQRATRNRYVTGHWVHDYVGVIARLLPQDRVRVTRYPAECWGDALWHEYGCIVEAEIEPEQTIS